jgi:hypothetical protein
MRRVKMELLDIAKKMFVKDLKSGLYNRSSGIKVWEDLIPDEIDLYMLEAKAFKNIPESEWPTFLIG